MVDSRRPDTEQMLAMLAQAEEQGYAHAWVGDSIVAKPRHEPLMTLAFAAARTNRIGLGTAVLLPALRHPVVLANELASLDHLSRGRLVLGVGPGWGLESSKAEWAAVGQRNHERARRLEEHIEVWRALWSGAPVTRRAADYVLDGHSVGPLPWTEHGPPIWITAGNRGTFVEAAFDRFGRLGDGIIATGVEPDECGEIRARGLASLQRHGREPTDFPLALYLTVRVDDDRSRARHVYEEYVTAYYGAQGSHERGLLAIGSAADVVVALSSYLEAGVTDLIVRFAGPDQLEELERFTADVKPDLGNQAPMVITSPVIAEDLGPSR
jgi:alkanesulfonate monooxygenase SsuD/methylene tetrahydromethanopterin reductase-like flavin-dependent oxidoreductase (luciferase family)